MMRTFCDQSSSNAERSAPISVLLHHLLKWLPAAIISISALELSRILKQSTDISKSQYLNYRLLAMKLCECHPPRDLRLSILNDIWKVVSRFDDRVEYLIVTDVFVEFVVQCCSENELHVLLRDILKHLGTAMPADNAFEVLESIVLKIIRTAADINCLIKMPYFADLVNNLDGKRKYSAHKEILLFISRQKQTISDPVIRNFVFETSKSLCKSLDSLSSEAELRQIAHLISYFIQLVYIDQGLEQHFSFLLDCREGFPKMDPVKETIVHRSNRLAMDALRMSKKEVTHSVADFVRTCVTFNEITISFLKNVPSRIYLYIETAEVAMMNGLVSHSESLIRSCFESLQELQSMDNAEVARMEMELLGCIQKLCSLLIMIPSHPEQGTINLLKDLVQTYDELRFKETSKIQVFLGILLACNALSQDILPYHVESVQMISNDDLFNGDDSYLEELRDFTLRIVKGIMSISRKLPGNSARDIFETFAVVFECIDDENMQHYFSTLAETAKPVIATTDMSLEAIK
ncbi:hypothetical protein KP509_1Z165700 [Ceratopteris richardii]|nr:hypothetical protein KP509_1Z165700 [Ceratopteris richardii]